MQPLLHNDRDPADSGPEFVVVVAKLSDIREHPPSVFSEQSPLCWSCSWYSLV